MKIIIIGSGLIGLTTAYFLARRGHDVTVLDRGAGPGLETSFANGALLTPSMSDPWNSPGCWRVLLSSLGRSDSAMQLRMRAVPSLTSWGITFLKNSRVAAYERNIFNNLRLALYSLETLKALREETGIEYGRASRGAVKVFRDEAALERAAKAATRLSAERLSFKRLSRQETIDLEPALAPIAHRLAGALYFPVDETGDAYRFCVALARIAERAGVTFRFGSEVSALESRQGHLTGVMMAHEKLVADRYIVAAGSHSTALLRGVGISLPVQPAKGYSVTFDLAPGKELLRVPVIDDDLHAAVVPLEGAIRVAGTAEFAGFDRTLTPARVQNLHKLLQEILPQARFDAAAAKPWCGLRPMSADGVPIIDATRLPNLLVSSGHGHLGWTMAAGSAQLLADLVDRRRPGIDPAPYALARFA